MAGATWQQDVWMFFEARPGELGLYQTVEDFILGSWDDVAVEVKKTQITFKAKLGFAFVSLPRSRVKGKPDGCIVLTFGLGRRLDSERIWQAVEPYPGRWTHHMLVARPEDVNDEVRSWLEEAHAFAYRGRGKTHG